MDNSIPPSSAPLPVPEIPLEVSLKLEDFKTLATAHSHTVGTAWNAIVKMSHEIFELGKKAVGEVDAAAKDVDEKTRKLIEDSASTILRAQKKFEIDLEEAKVAVEVRVKAECQKISDSLSADLDAAQKEIAVLKVELSSTETKAFGLESDNEELKKQIAAAKPQA